MKNYVVKNEDGEIIGYSQGVDHESAFYNFRNGALMLSDEFARFEEIETQDNDNE